MTRTRAKEYEYVTLRQKVLGTFCPFCAALPGTYCTGKRGQRRSAMHADRWESYRMLNDAPKGPSQ